ncbi:uncharacterized protein LOC119687602 [Teleopsis dalmanni]|uniref:uncharacterized protein LOC119687602 n=1 Tax=Teleopsis dalmanni TaxID=139649 RepID=UPI0018CD00FD|nr:uncharacterized protein LOC119687602 [Teleopsis dalmanni]XP_037957901.1 uncharacterized protein LOC119687602 [Teleopsis dalmanni]XP_037957902.1 uncharacterized protein LOC119687602 [Teleopsis dalmanni]XP_037957903.1 uncharacterized protein LOC119687602 [Teleopsis dalmanni]XP_037957904.1 uncharacterized protein LOC119687602 [Teleopsis dalmanni]XP_037957905.1 uncharacterized protein LOC119687602 [Teleopsis dalmanni]XP_037957906.1 uncharacterized protein LOC119687602 [Teleopsis dalmanni]XP_0
MALQLRKIFNDISRHQMMKLCSSRGISTLLNVVTNDQRLRIDTCRYLMQILSRRITGD